MSNAARELDRLREMVWELVGELERRNQRLEARNRKLEEALQVVAQSDTDIIGPFSQFSQSDVDNPAMELARKIAREAREG